MMILTVRTDNPQAEVGLYEDATQVAYEVWHAHRELSMTLLQKITALLQSQGKTLEDIGAVIAYAGPGSFTGLRIGLTVVNALAYGLGGLPVVAIAGAEQWIERGLARVQAGAYDQLALPEYGALPHITVQKK
jgi:tRNA threonylcarbamoyladenosine biosynthesis protein TsaB